MATRRSRPDPDRDDRLPADARVALERYEDAPDVCTIYDASIPARVATTWISAEEGSFVALEDAR
ncbi:hypothetical protein ACFOZ7_13610 [Natribaculum luteum]|uniref:DUF7511 domain-containing protein n=1 Tax=Natribaculum luteum TaxID=1586232 RepID=A0ABD5P1X8_9EURY|nr:hypothetical protein [Natribaculum luteum]